MGEVAGLRKIYMSKDVRYTFRWGNTWMLALFLLSVLPDTSFYK